MDRPDRLIKKALTGVKASLKTAGRCTRISVICARYLRLPLAQNKIFILSHEGDELAGNVPRLMLSIRRLYGDRFTFTVGVKPGKRDRIRRILDSFGFMDTALVDWNTLPFYREMETAAYLLTDHTFPNSYIPREGQYYLNTWHGTPYKRMGYDTPACLLASDNIQRNLLTADLLLYPSPYCRDVMAGAYCLDGLYRGKMVLSGYPRNSIFFDSESRDRTRERYGLTDKKVWAYLPTWREAMEGGIDHLKVLTDAFAALDSQMTEDELLYVKIHNYFLSAMKDLNLSWRHIRPWPEDVETYEFLNACDVLITDYSSVFFDYACTRRKIVRYTYDEETYLASRGLYDLPAPLPFPCVKTPDELLAELRAEKKYDDTAFLAAYCPFDGPEASDRLARCFIEGSVPAELSARPAAPRPLILLYAGSIKDARILRSLGDLAARYSENESRPLFYLGISRTAQISYSAALNDLPDSLRLLTLRGEPFCRTSDLAMLAAGRPTERFLATERLRALTGVHFDAVFDLTGGSAEARLFQGIPDTRFIQVPQLTADAIESALNKTLESLG